VSDRAPERCPDVLPAFIFDAGVHSWWQGGLGASRLAGFHHLRTEFKQEIPIPSFSIRKDTDMICPVDNLLSSFDSMAKETLLPLSAFTLPDEATGPVKQGKGPALRLMWRHMFVHFGIRLIAFDDEFKTLVYQGIQQEHLLSLANALFPLDRRLFALMEDTCRSIEAHAFSPSVQDLPNLPERGAQAFQQGLFCF
jgi:hypothetical protein